MASEREKEIKRRRKRKKSKTAGEEQGVAEEGAEEAVGE